SLGGIFLERQNAIVIEVELVVILAPRGQIFVCLDLAVLVLVVTAEALLFARFGARFGRLERRLRAEQGSAGGACGGCPRKPRPALGPRLPDEEGAGQQQKAGGSAGKESQQGKSPSTRRFGTGDNLRNGGASVNCARYLPVSRRRSRVQSRRGVASASKGGPPSLWSRRARAHSAVTARIRRG